MALAAYPLHRWLFGLLLVLALGAAAAAEEAPSELPGVTRVNAATVAAMMARGQARLIDTRSLHDYLVGHLPNARHVDYTEQSARVKEFDASQDNTQAFIARLGKFAKPDAPLILYCNGISCWKSYKACIAASKAGYREIYWFRGGMREWQRAGYPIVVEIEE